MNKTAAVFLALFLALTTVATIVGCDNSGTNTPQGLQGAECSVNSECISNACVYPGICQ